MSGVLSLQIACYFHIEVHLISFSCFDKAKTSCLFFFSVRTLCEMRFKDGRLHRVNHRDIICGVTLCPGDEVSVHCNRETYKWAMVLEYTAKCDRFMLAYADGTVFQ